MGLASLEGRFLVDLVAPGVDISKLDIQKAVKQVRALGFKARVLSHSKATVQQKFEAFQKALYAKDSQAIWCVRGGYGCQKLLPYLLRIKAKPSLQKLFIGYSDATVLHIFFNTKWNLATLHFPVLKDLPPLNSIYTKTFLKIIRGQDKNAYCQIFNNLKVLNPKVVSGNIYSYLTGGNMTLIQSSIGTPWQGVFKNKILFLEDVNEAPYKIDRALWQMQNAKIFKGIKALVLGSFLPKTASTLCVFKAFALQCTFPVITGVPCGHGKKKHALPFNTKNKLCFNTQKHKATLCIKNVY